MGTFRKYANLAKLGIPLEIIKHCILPRVYSLRNLKTRKSLIAIPTKTSVHHFTRRIIYFLHIIKNSFTLSEV